MHAFRVLLAAVALCLVSSACKPPPIPPHGTTSWQLHARPQTCPASSQAANDAPSIPVRRAARARINRPHTAPHLRVRYAPAPASPDPHQPRCGCARAARAVPAAAGRWPACSTTCTVEPSSMESGHDLARHVRCAPCGALEEEGLSLGLISGDRSRLRDWRESGSVRVLARD